MEIPRVGKITKKECESYTQMWIVRPARVAKCGGGSRSKSRSSRNREGMGIFGRVQWNGNGLRSIHVGSRSFRGARRDLGDASHEIDVSECDTYEWVNV